MSNGALGLPFLVRLRWGAIAGQIVALAVAYCAFGFQPRWSVLVTIIALTALSNALVSRVACVGRHDRIVLTLLVVDVFELTAIFAATGGASNPFTVFFVVEVALASLLLSSREAWTVALCSIAGFGGLFLVGHGGTEAGHMHCDPSSQHVMGMWIAYALSASFVAHFVGRVSHAIRERDQQRATMEHMVAQNERLATLSSFSANTAHELGTPLATIGLAAKELSRAVDDRGLGADLASDARLIVREVARCRSIMSALTSRAGESMGELPVRTTLGGVVTELLSGLPAPLASRLQVEFSDASAEDAVIVAPARTLAQVLSNLVRNACDAHEEAGVDAPVLLRVAVGDRVGFHVLDQGRGLPTSIEARIGEPFVSTKRGLGGLGLGIFLARAFADRMGGQLRYARRPDGGTDAGLFLQCNRAMP